MQITKTYIWLHSISLALLWTLDDVSTVAISFLTLGYPKRFRYLEFSWDSSKQNNRELGLFPGFERFVPNKKPWEYIWIFRSSTSIWNRNIPKICRYNCREATEICWEVYFHNTIESERCPFLCPHKWVSFTNEITHRAALYYTLGEKCGLPT